MRIVYLCPDENLLQGLGEGINAFNGEGRRFFARSLINLQGVLENSLSDFGDDGETLIIAINCHSEHEKGEFQDSIQGKSRRISADFFMNGARMENVALVPNFPPPNRLPWIGLRTLIRNSNFRGRVIVVAAQSYGAIFADELRSMEPKISNVLYYGLSYGKTFSVVPNEPMPEMLDHHHRDLTNFLQFLTSLITEV